MPVPHPDPDNEYTTRTSEQLAALRTAAINATHHASWSWNESALTYLPPSNPPDDGNPYIWDEAREAWVAFS